MTRSVLTPGELAARWGNKAETIRAKIQAGEIPAVDVSGPSSTRRRWRISLAVIERLERGEPAPAKEPARARRQRRQRKVKFY